MLAGLRPRLVEEAKKVPGFHVDVRFTSVQQAVGTPKGREQIGIEYLIDVTNTALSSGFVADRIDAHKVTERLLPVLAG